LIESQPEKIRAQIRKKGLENISDSIPENYTSQSTQLALTAAKIDASAVEGKDFEIGKFVVPEKIIDVLKKNAEKGAEDYVKSYWENGKIIVENGYEETQQEIANRVGVSRSTVHNWIVVFTTYPDVSFVNALTKMKAALKANKITIHMLFSFDRKSEPKEIEEKKEPKETSKNWVDETKKFVEELIQNKGQIKQTENQEIIVYLKNGITELEQPEYIQKKHEHSQACLDSKGKPLHSLD
jgi:hypothetical protein